MGMTSLVCRSCGATLQGTDNLLDVARDKGWQIDGEGKACCKKCALLGEAPKVRLRPCPHCGEPEVRLMEHEASAYVACPTMGCWMHGPVKESADAAVKAWDALPRQEDVERLNREADWLAEHLHRSGVPCPGDGEKFDLYGECAEKDWPCIACFRKWAKQETQGEKSDGQEKGN